jgi:hypothetical protein
MTACDYSIVRRLPATSHVAAEWFNAEKNNIRLAPAGKNVRYAGTNKDGDESH